MTTKFYKCNVCGNIIIKLHDSNITPHCCNRPMTELMANTTDAKVEAHVPCVTCTDAHTIKVVVGKVPHPMTTEHSIQFIALETANGIMVRHLSSNCKPEATFITSDAPIAVYAYCNLHGLWKTDVKKSESATHCTDQTSCPRA